MNFFNDFVQVHKNLIPNCSPYFHRNVLNQVYISTFFNPM